MRLARGVVCLVSLTLSATALLAQGPPAQPGPPTSGAAPVPQLVDRNGQVVGPLSADTGVVYTLPDGRKTLLRWSRSGLSTLVDARSPNFRVYFRSTDCSGPAYVTPWNAAANTQLRGDTLSMLIYQEDPQQPPPQTPSEGAEPPIFSELAMLYATESGARPLLRLNNFQSSYDPYGWPTCVEGPPPMAWPDEYIPLYEFNSTGIDLNAEFEFPFHVNE